MEHKMEFYSFEFQLNAIGIEFSVFTKSGLARLEHCSLSILFAPRLLAYICTAGAAAPPKLCPATTPKYHPLPYLRRGAATLVLGCICFGF
jgi:hypothetical protein